MSEIILNVPLMEQIRQEAARRVVKHGKYRGIGTFMDQLVEVSLVVWLEFMPKIFEEVRRVNYEKMKLLQEIGNKGKFTDSYGWSENREFKFEYEYTPELYFFMTSYVYADFFSSANKKVYRRFMKKLMAGNDAIETIMWAKKIYGSNQQKEIVTTS